MSPDTAHREKRPKILFVDDEVNILNALQRLLRLEGFDVVTTSSPYEALHLMTQDRFAVVVSDYKMPMMVGSELLEKAREVSPQTLRVLLTAHADAQIAIEAVNRGGVCKLLTKPWQEDEIKIILRQTVSQYEFMHAKTGKSPEPPPGTSSLSELANKVIAGVHDMYQVDQALESNRKGALKALARIAQMHSKVIWEHSQRVYLLCNAVGIEAGLSPIERHTLDIAALFHDFGLVSVPATILKKNPALLGIDEKALYQSHVIQSETLLGMIPGLEDPASIIRQHHEYFDGSGYPDGLVGKKISRIARILAIADAYDELQVTLTGQKAISGGLAMQIIERQAGSRFDPELIPLFHTALARVMRASCSDLPDTADSIGWAELLGSLSRITHQAEPAQPDAATPSTRSIADEKPAPTSLASPSDGEPPHGGARRRAMESLIAAHASSGLGSCKLPQAASLNTMVVSLSKIRIGMRLAEDLCTRNHIKLLPRDTVITQPLLARIMNFLERADVSQSVTVYRERFSPESF